MNKRNYSVKRYLLFYMSNLVFGLGITIDSSFGNQLGLDAICVLISLTSIMWVCKSFSQIGRYSYVFSYKDPKNCMIIGMITSLIVGIVVYMLSENIAYLFQLTEYQHSVLIDVIKIYSIGIIFEQVFDFGYNYLLLEGKNKEHLVSVIMLYVYIIVSDLAILLTSKSINHFIFCTYIGYFVWDIWFLIYTKLFTNKESNKNYSIGQLLAGGLNLAISRWISKIGLLLCNIYASRVGTMNYAIHSICTSLVILCDYGTSAIYDYSRFALHQIESMDEQNKALIQLIKQCSIVCGILVFLNFVIGAFMLKGDLDYKIIFGWGLFYCGHEIIRYYEEGYRGLCTIYKCSKALRYDGICLLLGRVTISLLAPYTKYPLLLLGLSFYGEHILRAIWYKVSADKKFRYSRIV